MTSSQRSKSSTRSIPSADEMYTTASFDTRLANLETEMASLEANMGSVVRSLEKQGRAIDSLIEKINGSNRWDLGVLAAWGTLVMMVVTAIGTLAYWPLTTDLNRMGDRLEDFAKHYLEHISDGHPERIEDQISFLTITRNEDQAELKSKLAEISDNFRANTKAFADHESKTEAQDAAQWERIRAIERSLFGSAVNDDRLSPYGSDIANK